jgi:hypothetical protein
MVRSGVLSLYTLNPPAEPGRVKIDGGPVYDLAHVESLDDPAQIYLWTQKCIKDVRNLYELVRDEFASEQAMLVGLLACLRTSGRYIDSEWCDNGKGFLAACDAYEVQREEVIPVTGRRQTTRYFLKFAIGKNGQLVLVVSCHI